MKTAGDLLREKREQKELTLEQVASRIKVKKEYLNALENSDFASLPSETTTKGFLRNYARVLLLNPETLLAMFRRDFEVRDSGRIVPRGLVKPISAPTRVISAPRALLFSVLFAFFAFLIYQLIGWWTLPHLELSQPVDGEVYGDKITVKGRTKQGNVVTVSGQKVLLDLSGEFSLDLSFAPGTHEVVVDVVDSHGRSSSVKRTFIISK